MGDKMINLKTNFIENDKRTNLLSVKIENFSHARNDDSPTLDERCFGGGLRK